MSLYSDNRIPNQGAQAPRIIETASATTSPDNSNSGGTAYVFAAVGLAVTCLIAISICSFCSLAADILSKQMGYSSSEYAPSDPDGGIPFFDDDDPFRLDDTEVVEEPEGTGIDGERTLEDYRELGTGAETYPEDILSNLPYMHISSSNIDNELPAHAYGNASSDVSDFARAIEKTDKEANDSLLSTLGRASRNKEGREDAIEEAAKTCEQALSDLDKLKIPKLEGKDSVTITSQLKDAQAAAIARWRAISGEVGLMRGEDAVKLDDYYKYEDEVAAQTTKAAESLSSALKTSRNNR